MIIISTTIAIGLHAVDYNYALKPNVQEGILLSSHMQTQKDVHLKQVNQNISAKTPNGCEECLQIGSDWVQLRLCLTCGHVGCCDSSPNKYAPKQD